MDDVVEVVRQIAEVAGRDVDRARGGAGRLDLVARRGIGDSGDAPHLVLMREVLHQRKPELAARTGDEDLGTLHVDLRGKRASNASPLRRRRRSPS
jgi:hypothetical protein